MNTEEREAKVRSGFATELAWIQDAEVREFVVKAAGALCQDEFWTRPASKSGKYHPKISAGEGGLVRHTKYACWWGEALCRRRGDSANTPDGSSPLRDVVIAALILHDMTKEGYSTGEHGVQLANAILRTFFPGGAGLSRKQMLILYGIGGHMGRWTDKEAYRPRNIIDPEAREVAELVHDADDNAARQVDRIIAELAQFV